VQSPYSLIINSAFAPVAPQDFSPVPKLSTNDYLRLASTFHSLHAITARGLRVVPAASEKKAQQQAAQQSQSDALPRSQEGIQSLEAKDFRLQCFQTLTGLKFLLIASPNFSATTLEKILSAVSVTLLAVLGCNAVGPLPNFSVGVAQHLTVCVCMITAVMSCRYLNYTDFGQQKCHSSVEMTAGYCELCLTSSHVWFVCFPSPFSSTTVLKNPFYELEMPIRIETFDASLLKLIQGAMGHSAHHGGEKRRDRDRERE
jgi:hypothetical protein